MTDEQPIALGPRMEAAVEEIKHLVQQRFPEATFELGFGEDPEGLRLIVTIDREDMGDVVDLYIDRLVDMQVDERLPLYVIPVPTIERSLEMMRREQARTPWLKAAP